MEKYLKYQKFELEKEVEDNTSKYIDLYLEFEEKKMECDVIMGKLNDQDLVRLNAQKVLEEYEVTCNRLKERVNSLEEEEKKWVQERTAYMEELESERRDKRVRFNGETKDVECEKARVEDGYEVLNTKFVEVEKQLEDCKCKCHCLSMELKEKKMERIGPEGELKNLMLTNVGMIGSPNNPLGSSPSSLQGNFEDARVAGTPHLDYQCELSEGIKDEKNNICFDSMVDFVIADREQLGVETNESSRETLVLLKQGDIRTSSTCIIEISDDEVMEICDSEEDGM